MTNIQKNISHFLDDDATKDNGGLTSQNKNLISFFIILFLFMVVVEKYF